MRIIMCLAVALSLSACTVMDGVVKDVAQDGMGKLTVKKCDLKVYLAFYGLLSSEENCRLETK